MGVFIVAGMGTSLSGVTCCCFCLNIKQKAYDLMLVLIKSTILPFSSSTKLVTRKPFSILRGAFCGSPFLRTHNFNRKSPQIL